MNHEEYVMNDTYQESFTGYEGTSSVSSSLGSKIYLFFKRAFDIICGFFGCLLLIPVILILKVCYMLTGDFSPIIFTQSRIGKNGHEFKFYKFRSMVPNADEVLFRLLEEDEEARLEYQKNKKLKNDPRVTKIGKIIRKKSIDELPQFINVLKGDMSMIGNRPYLPREKSDMGHYFDDIVLTKPGITGYWQVSGRSNIDFQSRCRLESYYSNHMGFVLDTKIFFRTFHVVLKGKGAE